MAEGSYVAYYRVSTAKQGRSGLGLEAQRASVEAFLNGGSWKLIGEFTEVESGKRNDRPQLACAMKECRLTGATLAIAKLDRLSRNAAFLLGLRDAGVPFVCADMPSANHLVVGIMAVIAQEERQMISARTKAALAASKARGTKLGGWRSTRRDGSPRAPAGDPKAASEAASRKADAFAAEVGPEAAALRAEGKSLNAIAAALTGRRRLAPRGGTTWTATSVRNLLKRLER